MAVAVNTASLSQWQNKHNAWGVCLLCCMRCPAMASAGKRGDMDPPLPNDGPDLPSACFAAGSVLPSGRPEDQLRAKESPCAGAHLLLVLIP